MNPAEFVIRTAVGVRQIQITRLADDKIELFRTIPGKPFKFDADIKVIVAFNGGRFTDGKHAGVIFDLMATRVLAIIEELRTEAIRIVADREGNHATHG